MASVVKFRREEGSEFTLVPFSGAAIKLLDLKRAIVEAKFGTTSSSDFDFVIKDVNGKEYVADDELVPRDSSVMWRRVRCKTSVGLLTRLKAPKRFEGSRGRPAPAQSHSTHANSHDYQLPMQEEEEFVPIVRSAPTSVPAPVPPSAAVPVDVPAPAPPSAPMPTATVKSESLPLAEAAAKSESEADTAGLAEDHVHSSEVAAKLAALHAQSSVAGAGGNAGTAGYQGYSSYGRFGNIQCLRCSEWGHNIKQCPTLGDPKYDAGDAHKTNNLPKVLRHTVDSLEGLDLTNKKVTPNEDGTFEIVAISSAGLKALARAGYVIKLYVLITAGNMAVV
jgi:hypothetical protein